jgi:hypothetical protein
MLLVVRISLRIYKHYYIFKNVNKNKIAYATVNLSKIIKEVKCLQNIFDVKFLLLGCRKESGLWDYCFLPQN